MRHRFVIAPVYVEPYFKNKHSFAGEVAGGWQLSGIYQLHSGAPFSYFDFTNNYSGYNVPRYTTNQRVTQHTFKSIPSGASGGGANTYTVGQLPAAQSWGNRKLMPPSSSDPTKPDLKNYPDGIADWGPWPQNMAARNAFRGPGLWNLDLAVSKAFPIHESMNGELRAEGFNILNHHNLFLQESLNDVASNSITDASGNMIPQIIGSKGGIGNNGGANDERRFGQFALKINF